ncbi:MAG: hypothetical protein ACRD59_13545 [Candidatus Acidiferrales bacterium]
MFKWFAISILALSPALSGLPVSSVITTQQSQAPSPAELEARADKLTANQHRNDLAIEQYERIERQVDQTAGMNPRILEDRIFRVVPTGTGTMKLLISDGGKPADPAEYRKQLQLWEQVLELALKPNDSRAKSAYAKFEKKKKDRTELIDGMKEGFTRKWIGREMIRGRDCDVIELNPNSNFHPHTTFQEAISRVTAKIWVDHAQNQLVRAEAHVVRDLSFGGGILGKLYRGGVFSLEQTEVAPGLWLPSRYQYDFTARKFLFTFEEHQYIEASHYRRIGSAKEALAAVQNELATGKSFASDP